MYSANCNEHYGCQRVNVESKCPYLTRSCPYFNNLFSSCPYLQNLQQGCPYLNGLQHHHQHSNCPYLNNLSPNVYQQPVTTTTTCPFNPHAFNGQNTEVNEPSIPENNQNRPYRKRYRRRYRAKQNDNATGN